MTSVDFHALKGQVKDHFKKRPHLFLFSAVFAVLLSASLFRTDEKPIEALDPLDQHIPKGFVLLPIEVANSLALETLVSDRGVVDLFALHPETQKHVSVARRVKMVRSPLTPELITVLVPDRASQEILRYPGPYFVAVQNPGLTGTEIHRDKPMKRAVNRMNVEVN